jgi:hypothetical protein
MALRGFRIHLIPLTSPLKAVPQQNNRHFMLARLRNLKPIANQGYQVTRAGVVRVSYQIPSKLSQKPEVIKVIVVALTMSSTLPTKARVLSQLCVLSADSNPELWFATGQPVGKGLRSQFSADGLRGPSARQQVQLGSTFLSKLSDKTVVNV